ncbi:cell wall-binding repeat-containing protein [Kineococcus sp. NPDC059986]|uniref:cell wall-binding repeat-containing protein n=1 Tax=Kineococcus sp. NPDC059986 TaxID=3155538 RepID=UPI00344F694D
MRARRRLFTALAASTVLALAATPAAQAADKRLAGADRYETAAAVSQQFTGSPIAPVFLATGENFPDALAAAAAAGATRSRVLLTGRYTVPAATLAELKTLHASEIYVVGSTASVSTEVETALTRLDYSTVRLDGADRYETAAYVATSLFSDPDTVFLATGENYPDALAGAAAAGRIGAPVLLVRPDALPEVVADSFSDEAYARFKPSRFFVLGDEKAVSNAVIDQVKALGFQGATFERLAGADRYATAVAVGRRFFPTSTQAVLAVGDNFPDALAAGPFAAETGAPLLLTQKASTPSATQAELDRRQPTDRIYVGAAQPS